MKKIKEYITERLILSKNKKSKDSMDSITLETFVKWCETSMYDIDHNKLTDKTTFDKNDIYDALECETAKQSGIISKDDYFDFYENYKNDYLENLVQIEGREKVYLTFDVGGINFYIHVFGSFSKDMKKLFNINIKEKEN
jgi:hypothetical protein